MSNVLESAGIAVEILDDGEAKPSINAARNAVDCAHTARPDCVIGLGGGSNMNLARITAAAHAHSGE